jgi:hypothetical protein
LSSSFQDAQAELKKQFLGCLIATDFECSKEVYSGVPGARRSGILQMHRLISHTTNLIADNDKKRLDKLKQKLEAWLAPTPPEISLIDYLDVRSQISDILAANFYGELHIGIIPTSTLPGTTETPENKPADPKKSSRI